MKENHTIDDRRRYLIQQCRYYKGEEENPYAKEENNPLVQTFDEQMWDYESIWVERRANSYQEGDKWRQRLASEHLDHLPEKYGIPSSVAGLLLSRYMYWSDPYHPSEGFEEWLKGHYLKFASKTEER